MRIRSTVPIIFLLLLSSVIPVSGQPELRFSTVPTSGEAPSVNAELLTENGRLIGLRLDPVGKRIHWIQGNAWYRLDLNTRTWTRHPIENQVDLHFPRWDVVPGTTELRAWDAGVGRVYRIDSTGTASRIDDSFHHVNQFFHIHQLANNGNVIAIGGTGLFHPKNFGVEFSSQSGGWHRISGADIVSTDPFLKLGYSIFDPLKDDLVIVALYGLSSDPVHQGILTMNMRDGRIRLRHKDLSITLQRSFRSLDIPSISAVHTGSHRMAFIHGTTNFIGANPSLIHMMDLDSYQIAPITASISSDIDYTIRHMALLYDDSDSTLYSVDWYHHTMDGENTLGVMTAKVDVARMRTLLESGLKPVSSLRAHPWATTLWKLGFFASLGLLIGLWIRQRKHASKSIPNDSSEHTSKLRVTVDPLQLNGRPWEDLFDGNYPLEAQLLTLLAKAAQNGNPIVSSDTVDRVLIPNHPSPDFIRKIRNQTRKRLEESLQTTQRTPNSQPYILIDRDVLDKRKTKLQLNLDVVEITPPK